jgi:hypothetical protein
MTGDERYDTRVALLARRTWKRAAVVAAALTGALVVAPAGPLAAAAPAPSTHSSSAATHPVTVLYLDPATGQVTRTEVRQAAVPTSAATAPATQSPAIGRVVGCTDPNSYWVVRNNPPLVCFANAGDINVSILSVYEVDAGNNVGNFTWSLNGHSFNQPLGRWTSIVFAVRVTVTHIHIN